MDEQEMKAEFSTPPVIKILDLKPIDDENFSDFHFRVQHLELDIAACQTCTPWESFFTCILQYVLHQPGSDELEKLLETAGKPGPIINVKINEIIRCSSEILNKDITLQEISRTLQNRNRGIRTYIEDFLQLIQEKYHKDLQLSFFDWRKCAFTKFDYTSPVKSDNVESVVIVLDPDQKCFRLIIQRFQPDTSTDDYFQEIFDQIIHRQEMRPYFLKKFEELETPEFPSWVEEQCSKLEPVTSVIKFHETMLPGYEEVVPLSNFTLLKKYHDSISPSTQEEVLQQLKRRYIFAVQDASKRVLDRRTALDRDKILRKIEKEEELKRQHYRLQKAYEDVEAEKRQFENQLREFRKNLQADEATKRRQEELIRQREKDIAKADEALQQKRCFLAWNLFRKELMETKLSYENIKELSAVHPTTSVSLIHLCENILEKLRLPFFAHNPSEKKNLVDFARKNDDSNNRTEILDILKFLFQHPKINHNASDKTVLEITGKYIIVSEVLKVVEKYSFSEIRFVAGLTIFLDESFRKERFHGVNVVMSAPLIEVRGLVVIDTSGYDGSPLRKPAKASDGQYKGRDGLDGEDGNAGESAGHVHLQTSEWQRSSNLTIRANGGNGGCGQDGGDGSDGDVGRDGVDGDSKANWKNQPDWHKYIDRGTKGSQGGKGGEGGKAGLGGGGGQKGDVSGSVTASDNFCGKIEASEGFQGEDGKPGVGGKGGPGGYDGYDDGCAQHNYSLMGYEWRYKRGDLDVKKQDVWYGGNGWTLIAKRSEAEVKSCHASAGTKGNTGKDCANRARQRKTTSTRNTISAHELFQLSKSVRNDSSHKDLEKLAKETTSLKADQALETNISNLQNMKSDAQRGRDEIDAKIEKSKQSIYLAEESKANVESTLADNMNQRNDVQHHLQKVEAKKIHLNSKIGAAEKVAAGLDELFRKQLKLQNQMQQQSQATLTKEFDCTTTKARTKKQIISQDVLTSRQTILSQYQTVKDKATLPDEVLPLVLASEFSSKESADAFEAGVQSMVSNQALSGAAKGFVMTVSSFFRSVNAPSSVKYSKSYLSVDAEIVSQTEVWTKDNKEEVKRIFKLATNFTGTSVGELILCLRSSKDYKKPKNIQAFYNAIPNLMEDPVFASSKIHIPWIILLQHLSSIMEDNMEAWCLDECVKHLTKQNVKNISLHSSVSESISTLLSPVRNMFSELKAFTPTISLQDTYSIFLGIVKSEKFIKMPDKDLWHEFVLQASKIKTTSLIASLRAKKTDFELIESEMLNLQELFINLEKNSGNVLLKLKTLSFVFVYVNFNVEQLQKMSSKCDELSCYIVDINENILNELLGVRNTIEKHFTKNHLQPSASKIQDFIRATFNGELKKQLMEEFENVSNLFGSAHCRVTSFNFRLKFVHEYANYITDNRIKNTKDLRTAMEGLKSDLIQEIEDFTDESQTEETSSSSGGGITGTYKSATRGFQKMMSSNVITAEEIPDILEILKLIRKTTASAYIDQKIEAQELSLVETKLDEFFTKKYDFKRISSIKHEIEGFHRYYKNQCVHDIQKEIKGLLEKRMDQLLLLDRRIEEVVKLVKIRIENSSTILHQQEILMSIKMHLIKLVDGLEMYGYGSCNDSATLLDNMLKDFTAISNDLNPDELVKEIEDRINLETSDMVCKMCLPLCFEYIDIADVVLCASRQLERVQQGTSTSNAISSLKIVAQVMSHCSKIELNVFNDQSIKGTRTEFKEFHNQAKDVLQAQKNTEIAETVKQLNALVTAYESSDFSFFFEVIQKSRQMKFKDMEENIGFLLQRTLEELEEIYEVIQKCEDISLTTVMPLQHFTASTSDFISKHFQISSLEQCEITLSQIYLKSFLELSVFKEEKLPQAVSSNIILLKGGVDCEKFQNIFATISNCSSNGKWQSSVLLVLSKLITTLANHGITCKKIHVLVKQLCALAQQYPQQNKDLEDAVGTLTTMSYDRVKEITYEKDLLEKTDGCISLITQRRDQLQRNAFRCKVFQHFEEFVELIPNPQSFEIYYAEKIIPLVDLEVVDIFGSKLPANDVKAHLLSLIESTQKHFYRRNSEVLGLVILNYKLNKLETTFCKSIADHSKSFVPNIQNKKKLIEFINTYGPMDADIPEEENRLVKILLNDISIDEENVKIPFVSSNELKYLKILFRTSTPSCHPKIIEKLKQILISTSVLEWEAEIKELVKNALFLRFLDFYFPENYMAKLEQVSTSVLHKLSQEFKTFRQSCKEIALNDESLSIASRQYDLQSSTTKQLETNVKEMVRFKHIFNRHFHFKAHEVEVDIFHSLELLYQKCLVFHIPFDEFNDIFYRLVELPSKTISEVVSESKLYEWMEVILIQLVVKNYQALCHKKENDEKNYPDFKIDKTLEKWKENGTAKRKLIGILADAIFQEVECPSGFTTIEPKVIGQAVRSIEKLTITTALVNGIHDVPLSGWMKKIRQHELMENFKSLKTIDAILKFEDKFGPLVDKILEVCKRQPEQEVFKFLNNFNSCRWVMDSKLCKQMETCNDFERLASICEKYSNDVKTANRDIAEISRLMREDPKNSNISEHLDFRPIFDEGTFKPVAWEEKCPLQKDVEAIWKTMNRGSHIALEVKKVINSSNDSILTKWYKKATLKTIKMHAKSKYQELVEGSSSITNTPISSWDEVKIQEWAKLTSFGDKNERTKIVLEHLHEVLAVVCRAVYIKVEYYPRDTQLASALILLRKSFKQRGCLAEVQTGEGKTIIVAMMTIVRVLCGDDVDVVTSSPVLAQENLDQVKSLFNIFDVTATTNCDLAAEQSEKERKKRYQSRVIYGDVASFQRDILLTEFFDKGITTGRTTDIIFIDEVDSMLLDKGENILYLSHNIQDLRSLWPIFVEIWNFVHAPDVYKGRPEDIVLVVRLIKDRIKKQELFFPKSLNTFINDKLVVWVQNAFLAKNMKENDPYILSDVNRKGPTIVIMDKDTGVEQVTMNWSNGLQQFIQLKHTDRLTSESLKAVFMSNICYFRKFKGKLFGITGTLGSTTERELLSKCYQVDFFAVPRFKARECIEDEGFVLHDESSWLSQIQEVVSDKCLKDRAVLIICENVESVDKITAALRPQHSDRVYAYKSSFDEDFRKKKEEKPLDCRDIIAATNIAGRGTDWRTSWKLQQKGGLHVILSYMTGNIRVEEQAFGRTARNGLPGSVQYILLHDHDGNEDTTVNSLRRERDENESKRLDNFRIKSIPRIEIEEKLCQRFHETLTNVKSKLKEDDPEVLKLHIENLKNKWALWLDSMAERLKAVHVTTEEPIIESFDKFQEDLLNKAGNEEKFESGPVELIKLGKFYEEKKNFTKAKSYFDRIIESEPNYSEVAHFYKAACILQEKSSDIDAKRQAILHLKSANKLLKKRVNQLMSSAQTLQFTDTIRRQDGKGTMSNRYEKQVENECELYQVHCGKIEEAIGSSITPATFKNVQFVDDENESNEIFEVLRKNDCIFKNYRLSQKVSFTASHNVVFNDVPNDWPCTFTYCKTFLFKFLKNCLEEGTRKGRCLENNSFCEVFKNSIFTREKFWNFLVEKEVLANPKVVNRIIVRSSSKEYFKNIVLPDEYIDYLSVIQTLLEKCDKECYDMNLLEELCLPPEKISKIEVELAIAGILSSEYVREAEVHPKLKENLKWNPNQKSWDGFPTELQEYQDLIEAIIESNMGEDSNQPEFQDCVRFDDIPLPIDDLSASKQIWEFLRGIGAIKDVRVNFSVDIAKSKSKIKSRLEQIQTSLQKEEDLKSIFVKYHEMSEIRPTIEGVMVVIEKNIGKIKTLPGVDVSYVPLSDYYKTGQYPPELEDFEDQSFGNMLSLHEKIHWWDWGAFIVAMLGLTQIIAGICLVVFTGGIGIHIGAGLISEGVGDILFAIQAGLNRNFSWTDYAVHKTMSLVFTVITGGIGSWLGRGVEAAGFGLRGVFSLLKLAGKNLIKQGFWLIANYLGEWGLDKLLDYIREKVVDNCKTSVGDTLRNNNCQLFEELGQVMDDVYEHSYENGQAEKFIEDSFAHVFNDQKGGSVGENITSKATEVTESVVNCLGNCCKIANHQVFANSSNKYISRAKQVGKIISYIQKTAAFIKPMIEMATYGAEMLKALVRSLKMRLEDLKMRRNDHRNRSKEEKSPRSTFEKFKKMFFDSITSDIINFIAHTIQEEFLKPGLNYCAKSVIKFLNKRMKKNASSSLRLLKTKKTTKIITNFQFQAKQTRKEKLSRRIKGKVNIRELDPQTLIQGSSITITGASNLFGDDAAFYQDSKGQIHFGKPSLRTCIQNFGKGSSASILELFVCACYFRFTIIVEDRTGELNCQGDSLQIDPVPHSGSIKNHKQGYTTVRLIYLRNADDKARFKPKFGDKGGIQELTGEDESSRIGLYQSLLFLKAATRIQGNVLRSQLQELMKDACKPKIVSNTITEVKGFVKSNLKHINIIEHLYEKLAQQSAGEINTKITLESIQSLSLDGVVLGEDGYGNGYMLKNIQKIASTPVNISSAASSRHRRQRTATCKT